MSRSTTAFPYGLILLLLLPAAAAVAGDPPASGGKPAPRSHDLPVPTGIPVQLDGVVIPAEWSDATQRPLGDGEGVIRLKQCRGTLLVAIELEGAWQEGHRLWLCFAPDADDAGLLAPPAVRLDFEPLEHYRRHLVPTQVVAPGKEEFRYGEALARASLGAAKTTVEVAIRGSLLGPGPGPATEADEETALRFVAYRLADGGQRAVSWPPGLQAFGAPGAPSGDVATSERWGRLMGWEGPDGPGALSQADWDALVAEDEELARRGTEAHLFAALIASDQETPKEDGTQTPALEGNLEWIAEREPLTPADLLALARGYRFWNRKVESLALLRSLDGHRAWRGQPRLLYDRALTLESASRFEEAATVWEALAAAARGGIARYTTMAERAKERLEAWRQEQEARRQDEAREDLPLVLIRTTRGAFVVLVYTDDVPNSARLFLELVEHREEGEEKRAFYDGTLFHRVIGDFLAQGGDPTSRTEGCDVAGSGDGPLIVPPERNLRHGFWRGSVGFALGSARMNGSQFFILVSPRPHLDVQGFTCFGHVVAGMDVVDRIQRCDELIEARVIRESAPAAEDQKPEGDE